MEIAHFRKKYFERIEWLKPFEQVYLLSEDELIEFAKRVAHDYREGTNAIPILKSFIQSITQL
jgi:hypothetical protein